MKDRISVYWPLEGYWVKYIHTTFPLVCLDRNLCPRLETPVECWTEFISTTFSLHNLHQSKIHHSEYSYFHAWIIQLFLLLWCLMMLLAVIMANVHEIKCNKITFMVFRLRWMLMWSATNLYLQIIPSFLLLTDDHFCLL